MLFKGLLIAAYLVTALATEKRLIKTSETHQEWMTEKQILRLIQKNVGFMDITEANLAAFKPPSIGIT